MGTPLAIPTAAFLPEGAAQVGPTYRVWVQCSEESVCMFMRCFARETKWKASPRSMPDALGAPLQAPVPAAVTAPAGTLERVWWGHVAGATRAWRGTGSAASTAPAGLLVSAVSCGGSWVYKRPQDESSVQAKPKQRSCTLRKATK